PRPESTGIPGSSNVSAKRWELLHEPPGAASLPDEALGSASLRDTEPVQPRVLRVGAVPRTAGLRRGRYARHALLAITARTSPVSAQAVARGTRRRFARLPAKGRGEESTFTGGS